MKRSAHFLESLFCLLLAVFAIGRVVFMVYNRPVEAWSGGDLWHVLTNGLVSHDLVVVAFLLVVPWIAGLIASRRKGFPLRAVLAPYYILAGLAVSLIIMADTVMYEFWQFKLSAVVLSYAASPEGAANSVSTSFFVTRFAMVGALWLLIAVPSIWITPRRLEESGSVRLWFRNISLIFGFLLCMGIFFTRIGDAYFSPRLFLNHAATNPVYAFTASFPMEKQYKFLDSEEQAETFRGLYPEETEDITDTLLTTRRPNVLIVLIESFGGKFVRELGGLPDVAPQWSRLIPRRCLRE